MTRDVQFAVALIPGGLVALAIWHLARCRHVHEMHDRVDGVAVLRCSRCLRVRANILAGATLAARRREEAPVSGIARMAEERPSNVVRFAKEKENHDRHY